MTLNTDILKISKFAPICFHKIDKSLVIAKCLLPKHSSIANKNILISEMHQTFYVKFTKVLSFVPPPTLSHTPTGVSTLGWKPLSENVLFSLKTYLMQYCETF